MVLEDAQRRVGAFLAPLTVDTFLGEALSGGFRLVRHEGGASRAGLLGADPQGLLADAVRLAPDLTYHSANASGPPPSLKDVADAADFRARIATFHARNYSVRFPDLRPLSPDVDALARALEMLIHQPVTVSAFWSRGGMRAPVHYDDHDLIVVQLQGTKRWYVANRPSQLFNTWKGVSGNPPDLGPHDVVDLAPGDLMYLPRGTFHTVDSDTESVHLAIGFTPLTLRDAIIAALDHLSDMNRPLRATVAGQLEGLSAEPLVPAVVGAVGQLLNAAGAPGFLQAALERRSSRAIGDFDALPRPSQPPALGLDTLLRHAGHAFSHLGANAETIDFAYPGGHLYIHRGAQEAVVFIAHTESFRVRDLPGDIGDEVRVALAARFVEVGFLELAGSPQPSVADLFGSVARA
ncbi:MAG: cupin domain-containing protein [Alphaproteobacteria bacterium]|nr:cupin domain-containing protein [Alphaproteobacteria bacterium]MBU1514277.1 cupin domain-containing protein [Alphaproteobacteria bacterium]MBU2097065.1 cupin domain-containing protein [Alphaproteobacteria bacterium]MBU2152539.1 cupin domain-containing protein [Alphaproteobacteria bacterium]MBU2308476.1 cupin domain-containing protein [Alphaproteobacteria bacterium]